MGLLNIILDYNVNGYYKYVFRDANGIQEYYLKSCKYNIMTFDFGSAKHIFNYSRDYKVMYPDNKLAPSNSYYDNYSTTLFNTQMKIIFEYLQILKLIILLKYPELNGNITSPEMHKNKYDNDTLIVLWLLISKYSIKNNNEYLMMKCVFKYVIKICLENCSNIFTKELPSGCYVINEAPYELFYDSKIGIRDLK
jgi:hypothetical protein